MGEKVVEIIPNAVTILDNSDAVASVVAGGGGIGISPTYIAAPFLENGTLVPVLKEFAVDRSHISAYWPESRRGNPNVKAFVGFLAEIFPNPTPWDMRFQQA